MPEAPSLAYVTTDNVSGLFKREINVHILRLDKIHPFISGNKWFKLKLYLDEAKTTRKKGIITFGGAWSNHLVATAAACRLNGLASIGLVRGEAAQQLSATLLQCIDEGMRLIFLSREDYRMKNLPQQIQRDDYLLINEGGYGEKGAAGAAAMLGCVQDEYSHYCCAVGTGTMMAGLINGSLPQQQVIGISALKNNTDLESSVKTLTAAENANWKLLHDYHFGGYAKHPRLLLDFMNAFYRDTNVPSDIVYTGKLFFAITDLVENNFFPEGSKILVIHSGGLQGNNSLPNGSLMF